MRGLKTTECTCGLIVVVVGFGLYSYRVRELLASLVLFTMGFVLLGAAAFGAFLIWFASDAIAVRTAPASHKLVTLSRHFIADTKLRGTTGAISKCNF